jgi:phospholipid-translocating ATPase
VDDVKAEEQLSKEVLILYEKLVTLEFTSERRRMSVIVKTPDGRIVLYCKGADSEIMSRLDSSDDLSIKARSLQHLHAFASVGLRTLVIAKKEITTAEYEVFYQKYHQASTSLEKRLEKIEIVSDAMEQGLQLLGKNCRKFTF